MILFIDQFGVMGGAQTVLLSLLRAALTVDDSVCVLAPGDGALEAEIAQRFENRVRFVACEEPRMQRGAKGFGDILSVLGYAWRFRRHLSLLRSADLVYVNGTRQLPVLLLLAPWFGKPALYHIHTEFGRLEKLAVKLAAHWPNTRGLVSNSIFVASRLGVASMIIENALDERFASLPFLDRFTGQSPPFRAAVIGTLAPQKGQDVAARSVRELPIMLHLIGAPAPGTEEWLKALEQDGPILVGVTDNVPAVFDCLAIQLNLVPSVWEEAFGLVAIEGMACSAITIVSGRGGLAKIASDTGALVAADQETLTATLARLISLFRFGTGIIGPRAARRDSHPVCAGALSGRDRVLAEVRAERAPFPWKEELGHYPGPQQAPAPKK